MRDHRLSTAIGVVGLVVVAVVLVVLTAKSWRPGQDRADDGQHPDTVAPQMTGPTTPPAAFPMMSLESQATRPACVVRGVVRWEGGPTAAGARLVMLSEGGHGASQNAWIETGIRSDDQGRYQLPEQERCPIAVGAILLGQARGEEWLWEHAEAEFEGDRPVLVRDIELAPAYSVAGRVVDPDRDPIPGAEVYLATSRAVELETDMTAIPAVMESDELRAMMTTRWADFAVTDDAGRFQFAAIHPGDWVAHGRSGGYDEARVSFSVGPDSAREELLVELQRVRPSTIEVVDGDGRPIADAEVRISRSSLAMNVFRSSDDAYFEESYRTGPDGLVVVEDLEVVGRVVEARAPGHASMLVEPRENPNAWVRIPLPGGGRVVGRLQPAPAGEVRCHFSNNMPPLIDPKTGVLSSFILGDEIEPDGSFRIDGLSPTTVDLRLWCFDPEEGPRTEARWSSELEIVAGEEIDVGGVTWR